MDAIVIPAEAREQISEAITIVNNSVVLPVIKTQDEYLARGEFSRELKAREKKLEGELDSIRRPINLGLKNLSALFKPALDGLVALRRNNDIMLTTYEAEEKQARQKLEAELRAKQEAERKKLEAQAEKLRAAGKEAQAAAKEAKAEAAAAPVFVASSLPKLEGISKTRDIPKFRIVDEAKIPREYLCADEVKIGKVVRATGGEIKIEGVEIYYETIRATSAAPVATDDDSIFG
jgi:hypothetical protein